ncbi:uncharacterized protein A4U43_C04F1500 [Asparagus officinalis]|uniref:Uncharacterized protein n=2 Tax=Asparagus officinalis TaxID=4686 RepID=A0A5P1EY48_ASPOF|nr:uncharacterized protein A4U43_C04F1500 [Asparagus officinalis]
MIEYKVEESKQPIKDGNMLLDDYVLCKMYRSRHQSKRPAPDAGNPNDPPPQQIQPPNKIARNEHKPKPNFDPTQVQPEPRNSTHNLPSQPAPLNPNQISDPSDDIFGSLEDIIPDLPPFCDQLEQDGIGPDVILPPQNFEQCSIQYDKMDNQQQNNYARIQFTAQNFVNESFQPQYSDMPHFELGSSSTMNQMNIMGNSRCSLLKPTIGSNGINAVIKEFLALL